MTESPIRREPPAFRRVVVVRTTERSSRLRRITLQGPELEGFDIGLPGASARLLLPRAGEAEPEIPAWTGNEFLASDGSRPTIRTLTPLRYDPDTLELDVDIVLHGAGPLSTWANRTRNGDAVAVAGTGRGYTIDPSVSAYLLAGDESALPAIGLILASLPPTTNATVIVEIADPAGELALVAPSDAAVAPTIEWVVNGSDDPGAVLVEAVSRWLTPERAATNLHIWIAGEAAAVQRIRRHVFEELQVARSRVSIRGYWKR